MDRNNKTSLRSIIEKPDTTPLKKYFKFTFLIPQYQRFFVWKDTKIKELIETIYEDYQNQISCYLGNVLILKNKEHFKKKDFEALEIIDGQQRTISIFIYLISLHRFFKDLAIKFKEFEKEIIYEEFFKEESSLIRKIEQLIFENSEIHSEDVLRINYENDELNKSLKFLLNSLSKNEKISSKELKKAKLDKLSKTIDILRSEIENKFKFEKADNSLGNLKKLYNKFKYFIEYFLDEVSFIKIEITERQFALDVFERLNTNAEPLSIMDLFKNKLAKLLFYNFKNDFVSINEYLDDINKLLKNIEDEKIISPLSLLKSFIFYHTSKIPSKQRMLDEIDNLLWTSDKNPKVIPIEFVEEFIKFLDYAKEIKQIENDKIQFLLSISETNSLDWLKMYLICKTFKEKNYDEIFLVFLKPVSMYFIASLKNTDWKDFHKFLEDYFSKNSITLITNENKKYYDLIVEDLKQAKGNDQFKDRFKTDVSFLKTYYLLIFFQKNILSWFLSQSQSKTDFKINLQNMEVEHIMPKSLKKWEEEFNLNNEDINSYQDEYIDWVGNLILLNSKVNKIISNDVFLIKKEEYKKQLFVNFDELAKHQGDNKKLNIVSALQIDYIFGSNKWFKKQIKERTNRIYDSFIEILQENIKFTLM